MAERPGLTQISGTQEKQAAVITQAATATDEVLVWKNNSGATATIKAAGFVPDEAVTGDATNNMALQFKSKTSAGAANKNITAVKTYAAGVDMVKFKQDDLVVSTTAADILVKDGESVTLDKTENGTGLALPAGLAVLEIQYL